MMSSPARSARLLVLICAPLLLLGLLAQTPPAPSAEAAQHVYTGSVHAIQPQTGSLDLITGVGYALRMVHISTLPTTRTVTGGAAIRFTDLMPGDKLRADCRMTPSGLVADRIEKLPAAGGTP